ncbi:MAG: InlB B-repeat-containing protein [Methanomassiliicoccaceae archaeon]|jgi:uncharacterized repeat protein (TIGR02543 family)|nr:InlB B-repeat-containing protein [Methanomassiliicoccaceae archaeon]
MRKAMKYLSIAVAAAMVFGCLFAVTPNASAADPPEPTTAAEFLDAYSAYSICRQSFGYNNVPEPDSENPTNHRALFTQNGIGFQLSEVGGTGDLYADAEDVTTNEPHTTLTVTMTGADVHAAFLGVIVTDINGNYLPGKVVQISVNGGAAVVYTTAASHGDNGFLIKSSTPISKIEFVGYIGLPSPYMYNGLSYIILASPDNSGSALVTYNSNGGSDIADEWVMIGNPATEPDDPVKDGFIFGGWYTDETLENAWDFADPVTGEMTLFAKWEDGTRELGVWVTYYTDGGSDIADEWVLVGEYVTQPDDPTKDGFVFVGWYTDETLENAWDFADPVKESMTLFVKWNSEAGDDEAPADNTLYVLIVAFIALYGMLLIAAYFRKKK